MDIVERAPIEVFNKYWEACHESQREYLKAHARGSGKSFTEMVKTAVLHPKEDVVQRTNPGDCVPLTFLFRTWNTFRIWKSWRELKVLGFSDISLPHVHLYYYSKVDETKKRKLLLVYPQFSGEFKMMTVFSELRDQYDILFICPLGIQCSWWQVPARHADSLNEYLPYVLRYDKVVAVTWSAGNLPLQILDTYLGYKNLQSKIQAVIRLDPLGNPTSNFIVYTGVPIPWKKLWLKFLHLGSNGESVWNIGLVNHIGCIGLSYLLKTTHGYSYLKTSRFLRGGTKLSPSRYPEFHFTARFDPLCKPGTEYFDFDRKFFNVSEIVVDGFHGMWLSWENMKD